MKTSDTNTANMQHYWEIYGKEYGWQHSEVFEAVYVRSSDNIAIVQPAVGKRNAVFLNGLMAEDLL